MYLVGLHMYYKMIHGPYNIELVSLYKLVGTNNQDVQNAEDFVYVSKNP